MSQINLESRTGQSGAIAANSDKYSKANLNLNIVEKIVLDFNNDDIKGLYRITSEMYGCDFYCATWKDVSDFVTNNIGDKIGIDIINAENLPYGFYFISKGKVIEADYDEDNRILVPCKSSNEDNKGNCIRAGSKVKVISYNKLKTVDEKEFLDRVFKVDCVLGDMAYLKMTYGKVGFHISDIELVKDEHTDDENESRNLF